MTVITVLRFQESLSAAFLRTSSMRVIAAARASSKMLRRNHYTPASATIFPRVLGGRRGMATMAALAPTLQSATEVSLTDMGWMDKLKVEFASTSPLEWTGDALVVSFFQPEESDKDKDEKKDPDAPPTSPIKLEGPLAELDSKLDGALREILDVNEFKGASGSTATVRLSSSSPVRRLSIVGLGKASALKTDLGAVCDKVGSALAGVAKSDKPKSMGVVLPEDVDADGMRTCIEGFLVNLMADNRFRTGDRITKPPPLQSVTMLQGPAPLSDANVANSKAAAAGIIFAKDLVAAPPNVLHPMTLAKAAEEMAKETGLEATILDEDAIVAKKMGAYLGVAQGAVHPPRFIHLTYKPEGEVKRKVAIVGKGLTFDSGGYNLKIGGSMIELMKFDMGGSAATLGAAKTIAMTKPEGVEVHFIVAACENMVSEKAMRPGDILTAMNGKTIEVINTDAEGRLTLADALLYAEGLGVDAIVDLATLTGACMVGLGKKYAGLFTPNDDLADQLMECAKVTGEKLWRLPLAAEYAEELKSKIADYKNVGGRFGGSITAALFLKEFIDKVPWAHFDIAGPVWDDSVGATGYGVKTLVEWVRRGAPVKAETTS
ncbi:unnamed protein product [Vitrella brassicaformis CCMP3155]|uniref:Cytosol aminopeptidase domain-containing protein n=2 Tax=Vitrella brassicaformis TaxID=1169539 RepID=A0A0G4F1D4_VITBC|nr:unnamed protein product [Vitrella brassicaformis CCMP3155]|eukprot:CEM05385.1 unnamed protein product [Vitrella brassicaformis CCMP3155]